MKYILLFLTLISLLSCSMNDTGTDLNNKQITENSGAIAVGGGKIIADVPKAEIEKLNKTIQSGDLVKAEKVGLALYETNKNSIILLNMLGNIYNTKGESKKAIKYLEEANVLSKGKDGFVLFNLGVSYSNIDKEKAKKYLQEAKKILPNDKNLDDFLKKFN